MKSTGTQGALQASTSSTAPENAGYIHAFKALAHSMDKLSGPKHAQLTTCIQNAIRTGIFKPGEKLPTEVELVALTPFSLGTVQRAIRSLVDSGLIQRKQRLGTFVSDRRQQINEPWHFRFLDDDGKTRLPVFPRVIARHKTSQRGPWSEFLGNGHNELIRIDRFVNVNDELSAYSRFFVVAERYSRLLKLPLKLLHGANFRILLDKEFGAHASRMSHRVSLGVPPAYICEKIRVPNGSACMKVEILAATIKSEPIYYQELTVPPSDRTLDLAEGIVGPY